MAKNTYQYIIVESVRCKMNGPLPGQDPFTPYMFVECPSAMKYNYPVVQDFE